MAAITTEDESIGFWAVTQENEAWFQVLPLILRVCWAVLPGYVYPATLVLPQGLFPSFSAHPLLPCLYKNQI